MELTKVIYTLLGTYCEILRTFDSYSEVFKGSATNSKDLRVALPIVKI